MNESVGKSGYKWTLISTALIFALVISACRSTPSARTPVAGTTATSNPTITMTPQSTSTPVPTDTPEISTHIWETSTSPNGEWDATITGTKQGENRTLFFKVANNRRYKIWEVENVGFAEPENPMNGFRYPYIFDWSEDGRYLYYSHLSTGGDGCYILSRPGGFDLKRFDLATGEDVTILDKGGTWLALSPDESKLAYISGWDGNVTVLDMESKQERTIPLSSITEVPGMVDTTGHAFWSPDGNHLVYAFLWGDCGDYYYSYIIDFDLRTQKQSVLIDQDEHGYVPIGWSTPDKILLEDNQATYWWLNPTTKQITPAQQ
jgi:WD40 repeat protein